MRCLIVGIFVAGGIAVVGCTGKPSSNAPAAATSQPAAVGTAAPAEAVPQPVAVPSTASPDQVVSVFLNALRSGDSPTAESLLTVKARQELAKSSLLVDVQGAPDAAYQVRSAEVLAENPNGAHVSSMWTEKFEDGDETYEIVWVLRREQQGWRLAGLAMQLVPDQQPQFLNFEDPEDMLRKKEEAVAAMQVPAAQTAQQPQQNNSQPPAIER